MKKLGFTLAEVLITLVIIGVIAAMTVPTLMNNTNAQEFRSALKKAISGVNQALTLHYALEGLSAQDYTSAKDLVEDVFKRRMSVLEGGNTSQFTDSSVCSDTGATFTTADGMIFCVTNFHSDDSDEQGSICDSYNTTPCVTGGSDVPNLWIDVNGAKNPNRVTTSSKRPKDIYQAQIYSQKVVPFGDPTQEVMFDSGTEGGFTSSSSAGG